MKALAADTHNGLEWPKSITINFLYSILSKRRFAINIKRSQHSSSFLVCAHGAKWLAPSKSFFANA
jgi:hypothetical protein